MEESKASAPPLRLSVADRLGKMENVLALDVFDPADLGHFHRRITNRNVTFEYYVSVLFKTPAEKIANQSVDGYHSLVTGDASPMDFWDNLGWRAFPQNESLSEPRVGTPHALRHLYREGRFILIFRNPKDRLYSDYFFLEYGHTAQEFHRDVIEAIKLMNECRNTSSLWFCLTDMDLYVNLTARVNVGMYSEYLKRWLDVFPASSFLFLRTEDFSRDIAATLRQVFHFLQLDAVSDEDLARMAVQERKYATLTKKQAGPMMNETRKLLDEFYRPYNLELAGILNDRRFLWEDK